MPSGNSSHDGAREPMPSDRPMNSQSASPARIKTRTKAPQGRASARPMTIARITNALRIRTISAVGFQPDSKTFWVVKSVGPGLELVLGAAAEPANPRSILGQRRLEILDVKVGPERLGDEHLRVGRLPQKEVAHSALARSPDDQVGVGKVWVVEAGGDGGLIDLAGLDAFG